MPVTPTPKAEKTDTTDKPAIVVDPAEQRENLAAFQKSHGLMGGAPIDPAALFATAKSKRAYQQFLARYAVTSAHEWAVLPTKHQDPQVRDKIGQLALYTFQCTVPDETAKRMEFQTHATNFIRNTGFVPYLVDMAHAWDIPGESVVIGFHRPIPLYRPKEEQKPGSVLGID